MQKTMIQDLGRICTAAGLAFCLAPNAGFAQGVAATLGKLEYQTNCQVCHGDSGAGDGPMAGELQRKPADLRMLSKKHDGVFPYDQVYAAIDGRETVPAHGSSDMPVWGDAYAPEVATMSGKRRDPQQPNIEAAIAGRILSLVHYLRSIQAE